MLEFCSKLACLCRRLFYIQRSATARFDHILFTISVFLYFRHRIHNLSPPLIFSPLSVRRLSTLQAVHLVSFLQVLLLDIFEEMSLMQIPCLQFFTAFSVLFHFLCYQITLSLSHTLSFSLSAATVGQCNKSLIYCSVVKMTILKS